MPLPRATPDMRYRQEEVDLQPGGSTITVEAPSDNPFELADDIEVVTQASGGMASADPRQRSRGVVAARNRGMTGQVLHQTSGFMPGFGDGDEVEVGLYGPVRKDTRHAKRVAKARVAKAKPSRYYTAGFIPGMGEDMDDQVDGFGDGPAAPTAPFLSQVADAASKVISAQATLEAGKAQRDAARAPKAPQSVTYATTTNEAPRSEMGKVALIVGGIAVAGAIAYFLFKKKA